MCRAANRSFDTCGRQFGNTLTEAYRKLNPTAKVPTLIDGDLVIWESHTILRYLAAVHGPTLIGASAAERTMVERWMDFLLGALNTPYVAVFKDAKKAPAERAGDFIFVSGQVAKDADGNMISGTIEDETRGTIEAIRRILAEEGATLSDVVRVTTYLGDVRDFGRCNRVFGEHFKDAVLARTTVEARAVINTKIEMDAIAYKPRGG